MIKNENFTNKAMLVFMLIQALALGIFVSSCSGDDEADDLAALTEKTPVYEEVSSEPLPGIDSDEVRKISETRENFEKGTSTVLTFNNGEEEYVTTFVVHYNDTHTNGHVIIKTIQIHTQDEYGDKFIEEYNILPSENNLYIEAVHTVGATSGGNVVNLDSEDFLWAFRTAEAMVLAYYDNGQIMPTLPESAVYEAGKRMEGRKHGLYFK